MIEHWITTQLRGAPLAFQVVAREYAEEFAEEFAAMEVAAERERCASMAENYDLSTAAGHAIAARIYA